MSDRASEAYNKQGMHLALIQFNVTSSDAKRPILPYIALYIQLYSPFLVEKKQQKNPHAHTHTYTHTKHLTNNTQIRDASN